MRGWRRSQSQCAETYESAIRRGTHAQPKSGSQKFLRVILILSAQAWPHDRVGTDIARPPGRVHSLAIPSTISSGRPAVMISKFGDWISTNFSSPISPFPTRSIISSGHRFTMRPCGTANGIQLCLTKSRIRRPDVTVSAIGFSTRMASSGRFNASTAISSWVGG